MARAGITRDKLAEAGAELADELGFDQVTVSVLARHFGVRPASLYSHVAGSHELLSSIALLALDELADEVAAALAGRSGRDALGAYADAYRDYARRHPGRFAATRHRLDASDAAASAGRRHAEMSRAILRGYDLEGDAQTHGVRLLGSAIHGFVTLEAAGGFEHSDPGAATSWPYVVDALDAALRSWAAG